MPHRLRSEFLGHMVEYTRFSELENGVLYAKINVKHHILQFLMPHFADNSIAIVLQNRLNSS